MAVIFEFLGKGVREAKLRKLDGLSAELSLVTFIRRSKGLLENELAYAHSGTQTNWYLSVVHHFQSNSTIKSSVDCGRGDMNPKTKTCQ